MSTTLSPLERRIGDLDHPLYRDERARHLSYEVYAVGYQALHIGVVCIVAGMAWFGDHAVAAWGVALFAVLYVTMLYTGMRIKGLTSLEAQRNQFNVRVGIAFAIYFVAFMGLANQVVSDPDVTRGMVVGSLVGGASAMALGWWKVRRDDRNRPNPAEIPDED